ncbi:MAG: ATP-dependent helicase HrpB [Thermodesulfovibrionales bacterium]
MRSLPVDGILPELISAIRRHPAVVLHAPPGAGKTTRVPLALLDAVSPEQGRIVMLEPRRIAAASAARWMARLLGEEVGETVGYSIRFDRAVSDKTRIEIVTEGILTRRIQSDPGLEGIALVIFDEFHERSVHADLSLALCLDVQRHLRSDLKILVMSATLDCGPLSALLGGAPVVVSAGRIFPVQERYRGEGRNRPLKDRVHDAVSAALREDSGDILVFLPGAAEIRACSESLAPVVKLPAAELHRLSGDMPFADQERAIMPSSRRKIVLATNVAETSLTIEGVRIVIDSGLARRMEFDPATGLNRLRTVTISKASAAQRKGRAGRLGPGVCYRLYREADFLAMQDFAPPEILVSDLAALALELAAWGVADSASLAWLDQPPPASWNAARALLIALGAVDASGRITEKGKRMVRLPLHPRLGSMLLRASELGVPGFGADLAALLSERPYKGSRTAGGRSDEPDLFEQAELLRTGGRGRGLRDQGQVTMRAVDRAALQLRKMVAGKDGIPPETSCDTADAARLLLSAYPDRIAKRREEGGERYLLATGRGVRVFPSNRLRLSPYIVAVSVDAGEGCEGVVYQGAAVDERAIREECSGLIETRRTVSWNRDAKKVEAVVEEKIGAVALSAKPFSASDNDALPVLCAALRSEPGLLVFGRESQQLRARVSLMKRVFPEEQWPDMSDAALLDRLEQWLAPWLSGVRNAGDLGRIDLLSALKAGMNYQQQRLLDERLPSSMTVPSGHRVPLDYAQGDAPVLAVKLQEMFGLADTPTVAGGRVKVLLHLLSPARRPVQVTQDLKGFWNSGYQLVKKELKGRYPKHPWPDDPWNAAPTRRARQ